VKELLQEFVNRAIAYVESVDKRRVAPSSEAIQQLEILVEPLPDQPTDPQTILRMLDEIGSPATMAMTGGRYFGFVTGATLPAALVANLMAGVWDQNAAYRVMSPIAAQLEDICQQWLIEVLGLPAGTGVGFVTGATMGNVAGLATARHALLQKQGWDVEKDGLFGAPPLRVIVGEEVHASVLNALQILGFGRERVERVAVDTQGRMRADALPPLDAQSIVCIQAGNVNTGAFDPAEGICAAANAAGAWTHIDGAFGLWAAASSAYKHLTEGIHAADSWVTDGHKWLNVPYDSGLVLVREPEHLRAAMSVTAPYLLTSTAREPSHYIPEMSRRARGIEIWAALRSLGKAGLAAQIERCCRHATRFAEGLRAANYEILNDVVLNQVLVSFGDDETTRRVITAIQEEGTCWCGGTVWQERVAMRISVSSWKTTEDDVERSLQAIIRIADSHKTTPQD
jgi:glutamate/tyrosine decarboxylase-like PLP-dependent enzyme